MEKALLAGKQSIDAKICGKLYVLDLANKSQNGVGFGGAKTQRNMRRVHVATGRVIESPTTSSTRLRAASGGGTRSSAVMATPPPTNRQVGHAVIPAGTMASAHPSGQRGRGEASSVVGGGAAPGNSSRSSANSTSGPVTEV